jgi:hypothetical protein
MAAASSLVAREGGDGGGNDPTGGLPPGELEDLEVVLDDGHAHASEELVVGSDADDVSGLHVVVTACQLERKKMQSSREYAYSLF